MESTINLISTDIQVYVWSTPLLTLLHNKDWHIIFFKITSYTILTDVIVNTASNDCWTLDGTLNIREKKCETLWEHHCYTTFFTTYAPKTVLKKYTTFEHNVIILGLQPTMLLTRFSTPNSSFPTILGPVAQNIDNLHCYAQILGSTWISL